MIFCKIDDDLVKLIKKLANGRTVVDCGAGEGLLSKMYKGKVISLDPIITEFSAKNTINIEAENFPFNDLQFPVFIRPCHSGFPGRTLKKNINLFKDALYISDPKNIKYDLSDFIDEIGTENVDDHIIELDWIGEDGEKTFYIKMKKDDQSNKKKKKKFYLVTFEHFVNQNDKESKKYTSWYEKVELNGNFFWRNINGGNCPLQENDIIFETKLEEDWFSLDWKITHLYDGLVLDYDNGWLSPYGEFIKSAYTLHEDTADFILGRPSYDLEKEGWIKLQSDKTDRNFFHYKKITKKQLDWLIKHNWEVDDVNYL